MSEMRGYIVKLFAAEIEFLDPELPNHYHDVAMEYYEQNDNKNALKYYKMALEESIRATKEYSVETAVIRSNLGRVYYSIARYKDALECYNNAIVVFKKDALNNKVVDTYYNIALTYFDMGDYENSLKYCNNALEIKDKNECFV